MTRAAASLLLLGMISGCTFRDGASPSVTISCRDDAQCPSDFRCQQAVCVQRAAFDGVPPALIGEPVFTFVALPGNPLELPVAVGPLAEVVVRFNVTEPLRAPPLLADPRDRVRCTLAPASAEAVTFSARCSLVAGADDGAVALVASLEDLAGQTAQATLPQFDVRASSPAAPRIGRDGGLVLIRYPWGFDGEDRKRSELEVAPGALGGAPFVQAAEAQRDGGLLPLPVRAAPPETARVVEAGVESSLGAVRSLDGAGNASAWTRLTAVRVHVPVTGEVPGLDVWAGSALPLTPFGPGVGAEVLLTDVLRAEDGRAVTNANGSSWRRVLPKGNTSLVDGRPLGPGPVSENTFTQQTLTDTAEPWSGRTLKLAFSRDAGLQVLAARDGGFSALTTLTTAPTCGAALVANPWLRESFSVFGFEDGGVEVSVLGEAQAQPLASIEGVRLSRPQTGRPSLDTCLRDAAATPNGLVAVAVQSFVDDGDGILDITGFTRLLVSRDGGVRSPSPPGFADSAYFNTLTDVGARRSGFSSFPGFGGFAHNSFFDLEGRETRVSFEDDSILAGFDGGVCGLLAGRLECLPASDAGATLLNGIVGVSSLGEQLIVLQRNSTASQGLRIEPGTGRALVLGPAPAEAMAVVAVDGGLGVLSSFPSGPFFQWRLSIPSPGGGFTDLGGLSGSAGFSTPLAVTEAAGANLIGGPSGAHVLHADRRFVSASSCGANATASVVRARDGGWLSLSAQGVCRTTQALIEASRFRSSVAAQPVVEIPPPPMPGSGRTACAWMGEELRCNDTVLQPDVATVRVAFDPRRLARVFPGNVVGLRVGAKASANPSLAAWAWPGGVRTQLAPRGSAFEVAAADVDAVLRFHPRWAFAVSAGDSTSGVELALDRLWLEVDLDGVSP